MATRSIRSLQNACLFGLRVLQFIWAAILIGEFSYFVHITYDGNVAAVREITTPLAFSVIALVFTTFTLASSFSRSKGFRYAAVAIDLVLFIGYLTSAGLYRHNFHAHARNNRVNYYLIAADNNNVNRLRINSLRNVGRINSLVRLGAAGIIIQVILYFITMLWGAYIAATQNTTAVETRNRQHRDKRASWFSSKRGSGAESDDITVPPPAAETTQV